MFFDVSRVCFCNINVHFDQKWTYLSPGILTAFLDSVRRTSSSSLSKMWIFRSNILRRMMGSSEKRYEESGTWCCRLCSCSPANDISFLLGKSLLYLVRWNLIQTENLILYFSRHMLVSDFHTLPPLSLGGNAVKTKLSRPTVFWLTTFFSFFVQTSFRAGILKGQQDSDEVL